MEVDQSSSERLFRLFADTFPQFKFPAVEYEEKTEADGSISYIARIKLLGQTFNSGPLGSKEEALESVSSLAYEVIKEFKNLVLSETDSSLKCEALSSLFRPLKEEARKVASSVTQEALRSVSEINNRLIEVENEKINANVKTKTEKIVEKMQGSIQIERPEPVKVSKIDTNADVSSGKSDSAQKDTLRPEISLSPLNIEESSKPKAKEKERRTNIGAPIPAFYEFVEKQSSKDPIVFDDFNKGLIYGCRLSWGKKFWVAPAEFKQKKDARNYVAVMACVECFGEGFTFEGVDPRIYHNWTRESVRQASDKYSFACSDELLANGATDDMLEIDPSTIKVEPLSDGRKFTSVINEICQKLRMTPPNFQIASVNTLTNYYVCTVRNFHDLPQIESVPFTKKNEAKEDAAGRIYYLLKQRGLVDEASRVIGRFKALEMAAQGKNPADVHLGRGLSPPLVPSYRNEPLYTPRDPREYSRVTHPLVKTTPPPPAIPPAIPAAPQMSVPPGNMMPMMMMMAQMAQPQQPGQPNAMPFDPLMMQNFAEMAKQWQAFLAWQQQQATANAETQQQGTLPPDNHRPLDSGYHHRDQYYNNLHDQQRPHPRHDNRNYSDRSRSPSRRPDRESEDEFHARKRSYDESRRKY